jgi:hypothetical protein
MRENRKTLTFEIAHNAGLPYRKEPDKLNRILNKNIGELYIIRSVIIDAIYFSLTDEKLKKED